MKIKTAWGTWRAKFQWSGKFSFICDSCSTFFPDTMEMTWSPISLQMNFWISYWLRKERGRNLGGSSLVRHRGPSPTGSNSAFWPPSLWLPSNKRHLGVCYKCRTSGLTLDLLSQNMHINKISMGSHCTWKCEKRWSSLNHDQETLRSLSFQEKPALWTGPRWTLLVLTSCYST